MEALDGLMSGLAAFLGLGMLPKAAPTPDASSGNA